MDWKLFIRLHTYIATYIYMGAYIQRNGKAIITTNIERKIGTIIGIVFSVQ